MTALDTRIAELERLAKAATPGPWHREHGFGGTWVVTGGSNDGAVHPNSSHPYAVLGTSSELDAAYIAAANPQTILDLLAALAEARHERDKREAVVEAAKAWREAMSRLMDPDNLDSTVDGYTDAEHILVAAVDALAKADE